MYSSCLILLPLFRVIRRKCEWQLGAHCGYVKFYSSLHLSLAFLAAMNISNIPIQQIVLFGSIFVVFYFFMMRPQQRRQREQQSFLEKIKKGQSVVTVGGIHGKIYEVVDDLVTLETDSKGSKITLSKSAISVESTQTKYAPKRKS